MQQYTYMIAAGNITLYLNGQSYIAEADHPNYQKIIKKIKQGMKSDKHAAKLIKLFDVKEAVREFVGNKISITDNGVLLYEGNVIDNVLTKKILEMQSAGFDITPMVNFLENLLDNPSYSAQQELMLFMEANRMPITADGHFLAYKSVRDDYKDSYSGKFDNSVGSICEMPRSAVNDNRSHTCSAGLHFAAKEYAGGFCTGHLMVLKINPADVVSIPNDYHNQKGRCCRYEVIDEVPQATEGKDEYNTQVVVDDSEDTGPDCDDSNHEQYCPECGVSVCECEVLADTCNNCGGNL